MEVIKVLYIFLAMSRRRKQKKRFYSTDPVYQSILVNMFVAQFILDGKKSLAYRIFYSALQNIQDKTQRDPLIILEYSVRIVIPTVKLKSRRLGGTTYQVPVKVKTYQGISTSIRWILKFARQRPGTTIGKRLSIEILDRASGTGSSIQKRKEIHSIAESNKSFVRYRF